MTIVTISHFQYGLTISFNNNNCDHLPLLWNKSHKFLFFIMSNYSPSLFMQFKIPLFVIFPSMICFHFNDITTFRMFLFFSRCLGRASNFHIRRTSWNKYSIASCLVWFLGSDMIWWKIVSFVQTLFGFVLFLVLLLSSNHTVQDTAEVFSWW